MPLTYSVFLARNGLREGGFLGVISDIHRVRTNPEVRIAGRGRAVHPAKTYKFGPKYGISNAQKMVLLKIIYISFSTGDKISERFFFAARIHFFLPKINMN